jgi:tRNA G18 (ribose-2'-O)-methylase SpoU
MDVEDLTPYYDLKERDLKKIGLFICEGKNVVDRMISSGIRVHSLICIEAVAEYYRGVAGGKFPVTVMSKKQISKITGIEFHRGVIAAGYRPELMSIESNLHSLDDAATVVICPNTDNPDNLGSIIRTSCAFGIKNIIMDKNCIDPYKRKTIRVSMGNVFFVNLWYVSDREQTAGYLKKNGFTVIGASLTENSVSIDTCDFTKKAIVFGHENSGIPEEWNRLCDVFVRIPMLDNTDSLNVSVAAGIFLYKFTR